MRFNLGICGGARCGLPCTPGHADRAPQILPHGSYLVNLGSQDDVVQGKSYTAFVSELRRCEVRGVQACAAGSSVATVQAVGSRARR